ncbi:hypothetical protein A9P82_12820 [Arachidicoccus ginsenosidimutans]|uniref:hypothetical protein n=1 Tax=Arachidicoccus sp. BS20 TaxID=1850526 RepID=UPI0007F13BD7|nr:hypothetical protein [Arachidicoccus sp. BS20]ANI90086.1 hypothetical protein A9P82_12820 [Arachidicoccus sp. BS20]
MKKLINKTLVAVIATTAIGAFTKASAQNQANPAQATTTLNVHCKDFASIGFGDGSNQASSPTSAGSATDVADIFLNTSQDYIDVAGATGKAVTRTKELLVRSAGAFQVDAKIAGDLANSDNSVVIPASDVFIKIYNPSIADEGGYVTTPNGDANNANASFTGANSTHANVLSGSATSGTLFDVDYGIKNLGADLAAQLNTVANSTVVYTTTIQYTLTAQ